MSNSLDPDKAKGFVRPDLGPNFLQKLSADDTTIYNELTEKLNSACMVLFLYVLK